MPVCITGILSLLILFVTTIKTNGSSDYFIRYPNYSLQQPSAILSQKTGMTDLRCAIECKTRISGCLSFNFLRNIPDGLCVFMSANISDVGENGASLDETTTADHFGLYFDYFS